MDMDELSARLEILELHARYARGVNTKDWAVYRSVFTSDAAVDYSAAGGPKGSVDEAIAWLEPTLGIFDHTQHQMTNAEITIHAGKTTASASSMYTSVMRIPAAPGVEGAQPTFVVAGGYYDDELRKTDGEGWRMSSRTERLGYIRM